MSAPTPSCPAPPRQHPASRNATSARPAGCRRPARGILLARAVPFAPFILLSPIVLLLLVALPARPAGGGETATPAPREAAQQQAPTAHEDLDALVREAIDRHPRVVGARHAAAAAAAQVPRAGALPDPQLGFEASNLRIDEPRLSASPMSGIAITLRQDVPFFGKLGRRRQVAREGARRARELTRETEFEVAARVKRTYWNLYFAQRGVEITRDNLDVLNTLLNAAVSRYSVGLAPQQDVLKAEVALSRLREQLAIREQQQRTARERLDLTVGRSPAAPLRRAAAPGEPPPDLDRATVQGWAREANPRLTVARAATDQASAAVREARHDLWPDLSFKLGYRIRGVVPGDASAGADMFVAAVGTSLPIYFRSKQSQRVEETAQGLAASEAALRDTQLEVAFDADRLVDEIERQNRQVELFSTEILPQSHQALDASLSDYGVGNVEFLSVLDNWQKLLDHQLAYEGVLTDRASRLADLEALLGRWLP